MSDSKRAVIYLRVSTAKQAETDLDPEGLSLPAQRDSCLRKAEELGAEVVEEYVDKGESAKTADRPEFHRMVTRIQRERDIDFVILDKINRFARNRRDDANILFDLRAAGAAVVSVKENIDDTPAGKLMHGILATRAEYESSNNGTEALKGMTRKAQVGGTPGRAPIGYLNQREPVPGQPRGRAVVQVDDERAPHIVWAFEQYATGEWTTQTLTDALEARGMRSVPTSSRPSVPLSKSCVAHMLGNRYYTGMVTFRGAEYQGRHEPIISNQLFEEVQQVLRLKATTGEKTQRHNHYLKGSLFCGICGTRLVYSRNKGNGGTYDYFKCVGKRPNGRPCELGYVRADVIEERVERLWPTQHIDAETADLLTHVVAEEMAQLFDGADEEHTRQTKRLADLNDERTALLRAHLAGAVPLDLLKIEQDRIASEIAQTTAAIEAAATGTAERQAVLAKALELAHNCDKAYQSAPAKVRRGLNQTFFERLNVSRHGDVRPDMQSPFKEIAVLLGINEAAAATAIEGTEGDDLDEILERPAPKERSRPMNWGTNKNHDPFVDRGWNMAGLVPPTGFEPATASLEVTCSIQLSYGGRQSLPLPHRCPERDNGVDNQPWG